METRPQGTPELVGLIVKKTYRKYQDDVYRVAPVNHSGEETLCLCKTTRFLEKFARLSFGDTCV